MSKRLWIATLLALGACLAAAFFATWTTATSVGAGSEAGRALEDRLRVVFEAVAAEDPPLRVFAMMPPAEGERWRWKVEATLRPGASPADPPTARAVDRAGFLGLMTPLRGKEPGGVLLVLHVPGRPDWTRTFDGQGTSR